MNDDTTDLIEITDIIKFEDIQEGDEISLESESGGIKTSRTLKVAEKEIYREKYFSSGTSYYGAREHVTTYRRVKAVDGSWTSISEGESIRLVKRVDLAEELADKMNWTSIIGSATMRSEVRRALRATGLKLVKA